MKMELVETKKLMPAIYRTHEYACGYKYHIKSKIGEIGGRSNMVIEYCTDCGKPLHAWDKKHMYAWVLKETKKKISLETIQNDDISPTLH